MIEGNIIADNNIGCYLQNAPANLIRENKFLITVKAVLGCMGRAVKWGEENLLAHNVRGFWSWIPRDRSAGNIIKENNIAGVYLANSVRIKLFWNELIKNPIGLNFTE